MNTLVQSAGSLIFLLASASPAMADPTREHIRALHQELNQIVAQVDTLGEPSSETSGEQRVANHLASVEEHLRTVGREICGKCEYETLATSSYQAVASICGESRAVVSSLSHRGYAKVMRKETHKMRDHIGHMSHEKSRYERQRLMRGYYRHVLQALKSAKPRCENAQAAE